jgi:imidazolonepropionase-like amidohydrolase
MRITGVVISFFSLPGFLVPSVGSASEADSLRYAVLMQGNPAGYHIVWIDSPHSRRAHFEFNDRGRGPSVDQILVLDDNGIPTRIEITGNDYLKSPVEERYWVEGGSASWKSSAEEGSMAPTTPVFYAPLQSTPEDGAVLARALLAASGQELALLPGGMASIERVGSLTVEADGMRKTVHHYAIVGLGFSPFRLWLDDEGELFAMPTGWLDIVREGWESVVPQLVELQDQAKAGRAQGLAATLADRPDVPVAFVGANLFDPVVGRMVEEQTVVVTGNRITAVGRDAEVAIPSDARLIDAHGKTIMPGLWDMHVHLGDDGGLLNLAGGVTSVRDMANDIDYLLERREEFNKGAAIGPRIVMAGFMDGPGPFAGPTKILVDTPEEINQAIDRYAELGYEQIKVYSSIKTELVPVIIERSHYHGLPVSGHIPAFMTARQAVEQGWDEVTHINMLFLNFLGDTLDTRTPVRFIAVAQHGSELDLKADSVQEFIALLKENDVVVDPTIAIFESMFNARPGVMADGDKLIANRLPPQVRRGMLAGGLPVPDGMDERYRAGFRAMLAFVNELHQSGVQLVAGTDALAGFTLHRELELYVEAGIPSADALRMATLEAAQVTNRDDQLGSIEPGKLADIIVVDGDPLAEISDIRRVELVMKDGVLFDPAELYRALGVIPWKIAGTQ